MPRTLTPILPIPPRILNGDKYPTVEQVGPELANEIQGLLTEVAFQNNPFATHLTFLTPTSSPEPSQITNWGQVEEVEEEEEQLSSYSLDENYPGEPWIHYDPHHHSNHIYVPASNTDDEIHTRAMYVKFAVDGLTGEPMIYGTMGKGQRVMADTMPIADAYKDDTRDNPLAYLDAYDSSYKEELVEYP